MRPRRMAAMVVLACWVGGCAPSGGDADESADDDSSAEVDTDGDGYPLESDCNDEDGSIHPGAVEDCDGVDDDCDGTVDEGLDVDADGDGFPLCTDGDDGDGAIHPGVEEVCNDHQDNDCDGGPGACRWIGLAEPGAADVVFHFETLSDDSDTYVPRPVGDLDGDGHEELAFDERSGSCSFDGLCSVLIAWGPFASEVDMLSSGTVISGIPDDWEVLAEDRVNAGDADGDGVLDLLIGASAIEHVYLFYGPIPRQPTLMLHDADAVFVGSGGGSFHTGISTEFADLTGDGIDDVIIGAQFEDWGWSSQGVTYVVPGSPVRYVSDVELSGAGMRLVHEGVDGYVGAGITSPGDLDGNGVVDLVISGGSTYVAYGPVTDSLHLKDVGNWYVVEEGVTALDGALPVNPSGGVLCSNPIGASGMLRFAEAALQVRGLAGEHLVPGARRALGHAYGGGSQFFSMWVVGSEPG